MNSLDKLTITYRRRTVGSMTLRPDGLCAFQYNKEWLLHGFSVSPLELPLKEGIFVAQPQPFKGNFGIFEDSLPDGYGRYLLHKMLKSRGDDFFSLNPLQLLSLVGEAGMGALCYHPAESAQAIEDEINLDDLQAKALNILGEKTDDAADLLYYKSGNSGGCRPKTLYQDDQGHWLVKFRHTYDPADIGQMEYMYSQAAKACGICVADFKLIGGKYFASRRFDITPAGERLHVATAAALLRESIFPPRLDYSILLHLTGYLTQDPAQVEEMFRRMVFNVLADNRDDHGKNFSFVCDDGKWRLAPAYDLTRTVDGYNGEHATSVNYQGRPSRADMIAVGMKIRISRTRALEIIDQITDTLNQHQSLLNF